MKQSLFISAFLVLMAPAAFASSSVLVPGTSTTNPYVPAPSAPDHQAKEEAYKKSLSTLNNQMAPVPGTAASVQQPQPVQPLDVKPLQQQPGTAPASIAGLPYGGQSTTRQVPQVMVPPDQLQRLLQMEKQFQAAGQNTAAQKQLMIATGQTQGMTDKQVDEMLAQQAAAQHANREKRIKALQTGNISITDLMSMYNGQ